MFKKNFFESINVVLSYDIYLYFEYLYSKKAKSGYATSTVTTYQTKALYIKIMINLSKRDVV